MFNKIFFFIGTFVFPIVSFGQGSGIYNGEFTEFYTPNTISNDDGCTTFYNVPNWSSAYGAPTHSGGMMHMQAGMYSSTYDQFDKSSNIFGGYNWQVGKTYYVQFRFQFGDFIDPSAVSGFRAYATSGIEQKLAMTNPGSGCLGGNYMPNPSELIAEYAQTGNILLDSFYAHGYFIYEVKYTCMTSDLNQIFIYPFTNKYSYPSFHLDYVRIRQCGSGSLTLTNRTLSGKYLRENIIAGVNTPTSLTNPTQMVGQYIILNPGFSSSPTNANGTFTATAVTSCDMPIEPKVLSKPTSIRETQTVTIDNLTDDVGINIYPNPARDYLNIEFFGHYQEEISFTIVDVAGRIVMVLRKKYGGEISNIKEQIKISALQPGTYILNIKSKAFSKRGRFSVLK
ncbi:T9SS type A sorting domain-containing protein [Taibaiella helva]|uniref:T9SS type A sorting domain-containing protein n=1 Tax=Taibaiella helva TaxID=2301235 RepID=UPI000E5827D2|nr:T9SS type A sorting domain-containing protein [Taibaiella helva]